MGWSIRASVCAAVFLGCFDPALAALPCGDQPVIPSADEAQIRPDAIAKTALIRHAPANTNMRVLVTTTRNELRHKFADIDKLTVDHYLLWVTCQSIAADYSLAPTQKFDEYALLYRLMSETIAGPSKHEE